MSRRSTPERLDEARRAATRNRLIGERVTPEMADAWIAAWEAQAAHDGLERGSEYWPGGLGLDRRTAQDEEAARLDVRRNVAGVTLSRAPTRGERVGGWGPKAPYPPGVGYLGGRSTKERSPDRSRYRQQRIGT